jgi:membrane protein
MIAPLTKVFRWLKTHVFNPAMNTFTQFGNDDGYLLAAGVAYYVGLSFFPLLMVLIGGLGWFLRFTHLGKDAKSRVLEAIDINISSEAAIQAKNVFEQLGQGVEGSGAGLIGTAILLFTAGTIFAQFERAFDRIWRFTPPEDLGWIATIKSLLIERLTAFLLMIGVAGLIFATFVAATTVESLETWLTSYFAVPSNFWLGLRYLVILALNTLAFGMLYHTMPRARVKWKEAFRGGLIVAIVWEIGRRVLTAYLIGGRYQIYGVVGALIAIQLWAYYAVTVILLGAEYVRVTCKHCTGDAAAEMNRRRFWQLMSRMMARSPGAPVSPPVTQPPPHHPAEPAKKP